MDTVFLEHACHVARRSHVRGVATRPGAIGERHIVARLRLHTEAPAAGLAREACPYGRCQ
eukprot:scaffold120903_cov69-Phaeocystis_antarctica.AAC.1